MSLLRHGVSLLLPRRVWWRMSFGSPQVVFFSPLCCLIVIYLWAGHIVPKSLVGWVSPPSVSGVVLCKPPPGPTACGCSPPGAKKGSSKNAASRLNKTPRREWPKSLGPNPKGIPGLNWSPKRRRATKFLFWAKKQDPPRFSIRLFGTPTF